MSEYQRFEKGKLEKSAYASVTLGEMYKKLIVTDIVLMVVIIIMMIALNSVLPKGFIALEIIGLVGVIFSAVISYFQMTIAQKNQIHIFDNCIAGTAAFGLSAVSFEVVYNDIVDVHINTAKKGVECVELRVRNNSSHELSIYTCFVYDCHSVVEMIKKKL